MKPTFCEKIVSSETTSTYSQTLDYDDNLKNSGGGAVRKTNKFWNSSLFIEE